jgi:hypothetical protein
VNAESVITDALAVHAAATPGPWRAEHRSVPIPEAGDADVLDAVVGAGDLVIVETWRDDDTSEADARAVALAHNVMPELLAVLKSARAYTYASPIPPCTECDHYKCELARAVGRALDRLESEVSGG